MALRQKPFLDEPEFEPDSWHCFNCGCEDIDMEAIKRGEKRILKYRSLYPLKMLYVSHDDRGQIDQMKGTNGDYAVCTNCYRLQFAERYPDAVCPV